MGWSFSNHGPLHGVYLENTSQYCVYGRACVTDRMNYIGNANSTVLLVHLERKAILANSMLFKSALSIVVQWFPKNIYCDF